MVYHLGQKWYTNRPQVVYKPSPVYHFGIPPKGVTHNARGATQVCCGGGLGITGVKLWRVLVRGLLVLGGAFALWVLQCF